MSSSDWLMAASFTCALLLSVVGDLRRYRKLRLEQQADIVHLRTVYARAQEAHYSHCRRIVEHHFGRDAAEDFDRMMRQALH